MTEISQKDRDILRGLAEEQAKIAALPVQKERAELWRRLNDLEPTRIILFTCWLYWMA